MIYKFQKTYEEYYACEVEADSLEEAQKIAEDSEDWYEDGESTLVMERWTRFDKVDDEDEQDELRSEAESDYELIWSAYENR